MTKIQFSNHIFLHAKEFYELARAAIEDASLLDVTYLAVVCNLALCTELILKANYTNVNADSNGNSDLLVDGQLNSKLWGHNLKEIFDNLPLKIQSLLEIEFKKTTDKDLLPLLTKCKHYFEHSRYSFEANYLSMFDVHSASTLAKGLITATENIWTINATTEISVQ